MSKVIPTETKIPIDIKEVPIQVKEIKESIKERYYILYYHFPHSKIESKVFGHSGNLTSAIIRGRDHCEVMNYRFIKVRPFIVNLDDQERRRLENSDYDAITSDE